MNFPNNTQNAAVDRLLVSPTLLCPLRLHLPEITLRASRNYEQLTTNAVQLDHHTCAMKVGGKLMIVSMLSDRLVSFGSPLLQSTKQEKIQI